jgi:hypothetical protein
MSNDLHVLLSVWVGPTTTAWLIENLLGGREAGVRCSPDDEWSGSLGACLKVYLPGADFTRILFFQSASDVRGRRQVSTGDCVFWRLVLGGLLRVVAGSVRNEYADEPDVSERVPRPYLDLEDERSYPWLERSSQRMVLPDLQLVYALAALD